MKSLTHTGILRGMFMVWREGKIDENRTQKFPPHLIIQPGSCLVSVQAAIITEDQVHGVDVPLLVTGDRRRS